MGKTDWLRRTSKAKLAVIFVAMLVIVLGIGLGVSSHQSAVNNSLLKSAETHFVVTQHGIIPQEKIDQTLVGLERAWQQIRDQVPEAQSHSAIHVYIYENMGEYKKYSGAALWSGGTARLTIAGYELHLPIEQDNTQSDSEWMTLSTMHEMTHIAMYMIVDSQSEAIPSWFAEGLAEYEMVKGKWFDINMVMRRDSMRYFVWRNWDNVSSNQFLLSYVPSYSSSATEVDVFYGGSYEFFRFLANKYSEESLLNILRDVGRGEDFSQAFINITGEDYEQAYADWLESF